MKIFSGSITAYGNCKHLTVCYRASRAILQILHPPVIHVSQHHVGNSITRRIWTLPLSLFVFIPFPRNIPTRPVHGERLWRKRVHGRIQEDRLSRNSGYQAIAANELKGELEFPHIIHYVVFLGACFFRGGKIPWNRRFRDYSHKFDRKFWCRCWAAPWLWSRHFLNSTNFPP